MSLRLARLVLTKRYSSTNMPRMFNRVVTVYDELLYCSSSTQ